MSIPAENPLLPKLEQPSLIEVDFLQVHSE